MAFDIPSACTLPTAERPIRLREFDDLLATSSRRADRMSATSLTLHLAGEAGLEQRTRDLAARETECCSFFTFDVATGGDDVILTVAVPPQHSSILDSLEAKTVTVS